MRGRKRKEEEEAVEEVEEKTMEGKGKLTEEQKKTRRRLEEDRDRRRIKRKEEEEKKEQKNGEEWRMEVRYHVQTETGKIQPHTCTWDPSPGHHTDGNTMASYRDKKKRNFGKLLERNSF